MMLADVERTKERKSIASSEAAKLKKVWGCKPLWGFFKCRFLYDRKNLANDQKAKASCPKESNLLMIVRESVTQNIADERWMSTYETALACVLRQMGWEIVRESEKNSSSVSEKESFSLCVWSSRLFWDVLL